MHLTCKIDCSEKSVYVFLENNFSFSFTISLLKYFIELLKINTYQQSKFKNLHLTSIFFIYQTLKYHGYFLHALISYII